MTYSVKSESNPLRTASRKASVAASRSDFTRSGGSFLWIARMRLRWGLIFSSTREATAVVIGFPSHASAIHWATTATNRIAAGWLGTGS